jgi:hypothetical protein
MIRMKQPHLGEYGFSGRIITHTLITLLFGVEGDHEIKFAFKYWNDSEHNPFDELNEAIRREIALQLQVRLQYDVWYYHETHKRFYILSDPYYKRNQSICMHQFRRLSPKWRREIHILNATPALNFLDTRWLWIDDNHNRYMVTVDDQSLLEFTENHFR